MSCFACENKNGGHFTRFKSKNLAKLIIANNMARTARRQLCYLENICGAEPKRALSKVNLASMEVSMF